MKKSILTICITLFFALAMVFAITFGSACRKVENTMEGYTENTEKINNPDQGFYRPIFVRLNDGGASWNKNIITSGTQLYHLRVDISAFSSNGTGTDKPLTEAALAGFEGVLSTLNEKEKSAIVRFAYDEGYGGKKDCEPEFNVLLNHIAQFAKIVNKYPLTVTAVEAGLVGPWGEMHSSKIANKEHLTPIIEKLLTEVETAPVLVRTPKMIYDYLGISANDALSYEIKEGDKAYRLGLFNDGYLGSDSDLGTYSNRERDVEFLSAQNNHLPYGGEVVIPDSPLHDIENCTPEMFKLSLSYLNVEWNNNVIDKWKKSTYTKKCGDDSAYYGKTAFEYIENRMGYRFVVADFTFDNPDVINFELKIKNLGFGNLNRTKKCKLLFVQEGMVVAQKQVEDFTGKEDISYTFDADFGKGEFEVYMCVYGEERAGVPAYAIQFANVDCWNADLKANKLGQIYI